MKNLILFIGLLTIASVFSCSKQNAAKPVHATGSQLDTSKTLIANTELVGNWNVVSDSVSTAVSDTIYHGVSTDHYVFTKYANLYINCGFNKLIDTAIYTVGAGGQLSWQNLWGGYFGAYGKENSFVGGYVVTTVNTHSLILTSNTLPPSGTGPRYESIVLKK